MNTNNISSYNLTWMEAQNEMRKGNWVRHYFFSDHECISFKNKISNMIIFEDDTVIEKEQFEVFRFNNSYRFEQWNNNWKVCEKIIEYD